ncbi:MAG: SGNH/GDSL hydrolase family protein [Ruminococcus sp.]
MKITEKIKFSQTDLIKHGPINIVAFGDSITHGAVGFGEIDYENVYWNLLKRKINKLNPYVPVNVINGGIGGTTALSSIERMERQVLSHNPDLVIVCFGLNDVNGTKEDYLNSLEIIFGRLKAQKIETVFMTPNMLNTYVAADTPKQFVDYAAKTAEMQNSGKMDDYIYGATALANQNDVTICDCYSQWKKLSETQDTTLLLANRINHPVREMHKLFADSLFESIFGTACTQIHSEESTMYKE